MSTTPTTVPASPTSLPPSPSISRSRSRVETPSRECMIHVRIVKGQDLELKDKKGKANFYCHLMLDKSRKFRTKTIPQNVDPVWDQVCTFDCNHDEVLEVKVYNEDGLRDSLVGKAVVTLLSLPQGKFVKEWAILLDANKQVGRVELIYTLQPGRAPAPDRNSTTWAGHPLFDKAPEVTRDESLEAKEIESVITWSFLSGDIARLHATLQARSKTINTLHLFPNNQSLLGYLLKERTGNLDLFLKAGLDLAALSKDPSVLYWAVRRGWQESFIQKLIKAKADVNLPMKNGRTPLFAAVSSPLTVDYLAGRDPSITPTLDQ